MPLGNDFAVVSSSIRVSLSSSIAHLLMAGLGLALPYPHTGACNLACGVHRFSTAFGSLIKAIFVQC